MQVINLQAEQLSPQAFEPFGQVISPVDDNKRFSEDDAQLTLSKGTPRLYIMHVPPRGLQFDQITYHANVTQCLCSLAQKPWYLAVAAPSHALEKFPQQGDLKAFCIPPGIFVKLHEGTWHAGPLFEGEQVCDFVNLELADTNISDHNTHKYTTDGLHFEVDAL